MCLKMGVTLMTPYKLILDYFNKVYGEAYKKKFMQKPKNNHFNDKNVILTTYVKKIGKKKSEK